MERDQNLWWETLGKLQKILRKAANILYVNGKFNRDQMHNYFMSVTEREVTNGILNADQDIAEHGLAYVRVINNINLEQMRTARNFIDYLGRNVDVEAVKLLEAIRDEKMPAKLPEKNIGRFNIEWDAKDGVSSEVHADYLVEFGDHFYRQMKWLIDEGQKKNKALDKNPLYTEILQHLHACSRSTRVFQGREDLIQTIHDYVSGDCSYPLIFYGISGSGKTSTLAKGASMIRNWWIDESESCKNPVVIMRFLGTTPDSSAIVALLRSLCMQICENFGQPIDEIPNSEVSPLTSHLKKLMGLATQEQPIALVLDSLNQLSPSDGAHQMAWLPINLPPYTKVVVSTLMSDDFGSPILTQLRKMIELPEQYIQIQPLGEDLAIEVLRGYLAASNRDLSEKQWPIVAKALKCCTLPLFTKLVFDDVVKWRSYTKLESTTLSYTVQDSIIKLLDRVEKQHGSILVSHALCYITCSKSGLSEAELEDLLSLDDTVLNDVYQYHLPPVRRIPPLLWTRIRSDMPGYLAEREADGTNVINWYHKQFVDACRARYLKNMNFMREVHSDMAEYFVGTYGGGTPKPFQYSELQRQRFYLVDSNAEADRKCPAQPLVFHDKHGNIVRYNRRKVSELPYHLLMSKRFDDLHEMVLFNYKFLVAKISSMPLQTVLQDFEDFLEIEYDRDTKLLSDALRLSASVLAKYPSNLAPQIIGRLIPYYGSNMAIRDLIDQCDLDGIRDCALLPTAHCMHTPGGPLQYSLEGHQFAPYGVKLTRDGRYVVSASNRLVMYDLTTGEVFRTITPGIEGIMQALELSPNEKHSVSYTNNNKLVICSIMTGESKIVDFSQQGFEILGCSLTNEKMIFWTKNCLYTYSLDGRMIEEPRSFTDVETLVHATIINDIVCLMLRTKVDDKGDEFEFRMLDTDKPPVSFHSALAISKDGHRCWMLPLEEGYKVAEYQYESDKGWIKNRDLAENQMPVICLTASDNMNYLVATHSSGYKLWNLISSDMYYLSIPPAIRNIPSRNPFSCSMVEFSNDGYYVAAAVRNFLFVWDTSRGVPVKTLDAHFGRIVSLVADHASKSDKLLSSSMDKTIKVWSFMNIEEDIHSIDRQEKTIEAISMDADARIAATVTRNGVGIWDLGSGRLEKTLARLSYGVVITVITLTKDGKFLVASESGHIVFWDVEAASVVCFHPLEDILQLLLIDTESTCKVIAISRVSGGEKNHVECRHVPSGEPVYEFNFNIVTPKKAVMSHDYKFLICPGVDKKTQPVLWVYDAQFGDKLHNVKLDYAGYIDLQRIVAMRHNSNLVAVIDAEKGVIIDLKKKTVIRQVPEWKGSCTKSGKYSLQANNRGGMELVDLKHGKAVRTLLPRRAEGVFSVEARFTPNDKYAVHYHTGHRAIRVVRVSDAKLLAEYKCHAEVTAWMVSDNSHVIAVGGVDGSLVPLLLADPESEKTAEIVRALPTRSVPLNPRKSVVMQRKHRKMWGALAIVARATVKTRRFQRSQACSTA